MADHNGVIVAGGDLGAELFALGGSKVLPGGNQHLRAGVELQEVSAPLFRQMVRDHKKGLLIQPQPFALHAGGDHFKGLARTNTVGQQRVPAIEHPGHGVALVGFQLVLRVHAGKLDVIPVVFTGSNRIEQAVVGGAEIGAALRVLENPVLERLANGLLLLLGDYGFLLIENTFFPSALVNRIIYPRIPQIQSILKKRVGAAALGAVGGPDERIITLIRTFALDIPFDLIRCFRT